MLIAFDIDGTLQGRYSINQDMHDLLRKFAAQDIDIVVWSGGGADYARQYVERHNLPATATCKRNDLDVDLAIDDINTTTLGKVNLFVYDL